MRFKPAVTVIFSFCLCSMLSAQIDFYADDTVGCAPFTVKFSLDHSTVDTNSLTSVEWDFGTGSQITSFNPPPVEYASPGNYTVSIIIDGDAANPVTKTNYIAVHSKVLAEFEGQVLQAPFKYEFTPTEPITDNSATYYYFWTYYNDTSSIGNITYIVNYQVPAPDSITFPDYGTYRITLNISDSYGCSDSTSQNLEIIPIDTAGFTVGNVFAPENEGYFVIDPGDPSVVLSFKLYSRTGVIVYSTETQQVYWDGKTNSGRDLETGVYFYTVEAVAGINRSYYSTKGYIHLFR